jgi:hypothetical protein
MCGYTLSKATIKFWGIYKRTPQYMASFRHPEHREKPFLTKFYVETAVFNVKSAVFMKSKISFR